MCHPARPGEPNQRNDHECDLFMTIAPRGIIEANLMQAILTSPGSRHADTPIHGEGAGIRRKINMFALPSEPNWRGG